MKADYNKVIVDLLFELFEINLIDENCISKIQNIVSKYFAADECKWFLSKKNNDLYDSDYNSKFGRVRFISVNDNNKEEIFVIINPKVEKDLEDFLISKLKVVLPSISNNIFEINNLKNEVFIDALTGIANNTAFQKLLSSKSMFKDVGVCFIDVNGLGIVNNLYGHDEGDKMLIGVADAIKKYIRKTDVYKKGGDEFIIVCENIDKTLFMEKIAKIKETLSDTGYSASFGVVYKEQTNNLINLINIADELMYEEKEKYRMENPDKYSIKR